MFQDKITDQKAKCPVCGFVFKLEIGFPDVDGEGRIGCPICFAVVKKSDK